MRVISERGIVGIMNEDAEGGGGLIVWVLLEVGVVLAMNGEVTAENRPACDLVSACTRKYCTKIVLLHELSVVPTDPHEVPTKELSPRVFLSGR